MGTKMKSFGTTLGTNASFYTQSLNHVIHLFIVCQFRYYRYCLVIEYHFHCCVHPAPNNLISNKFRTILETPLIWALYSTIIIIVSGIQLPLAGVTQIPRQLIISPGNVTRVNEQKHKYVCRAPGKMKTNIVARHSRRETTQFTPNICRLDCQNAVCFRLDVNRLRKFERLELTLFY